MMQQMVLFFPPLLFVRSVFRSDLIHQVQTLNLAILTSTFISGSNPTRNLHSCGLRQVPPHALLLVCVPPQTHVTKQLADSS